MEIGEIAEIVILFGLYVILFLIGRFDNAMR